MSNRRASSILSGDGSPDARARAGASFTDSMGRASRMLGNNSNQPAIVSGATRNTTMHSNEYGLDNQGSFKMRPTKKSRTVKPTSRERSTTTTVTNIKLKHGFNEKRDRSNERNNRSGSALGGPWQHHNQSHMEKQLKPHTEKTSLRSSTNMTASKRGGGSRPMTSS